MGQQRKEEGPGGRQARRKEPTTPEGVVGGSAALLCWRNGVKEREKVAELPPGLDELWGGEELAWSLVRQ